MACPFSKPRCERTKMSVIKSAGLTNHLWRAIKYHTIL
jgi:hypothetical protein